MSDLGGKGMYFVSGRSFGSVTVYHLHSKESTGIVSEDATQPIISPDGKRGHVRHRSRTSKDRTLGVGH